MGTVIVRPANGRVLIIILMILDSARDRDGKRSKVTEGMMGEFLRDLMNPFSNQEEVSSAKDVSIEAGVNDKLLGVEIDTFLHEVSQCHKKIDEYEANLQQIERLQTNIWKGLKWGLEQRKKMSEEIEEKCARNKQIHTDVRKTIRTGYTGVKFKKEQEEAIRKQQLSGLTERMKSCIKKSLELDTNYEKMAKQKLVNEIRILGIKGMSEEEIEHKVSSNDLESIIASRGIVQDTKEAEKTLAEINERHDDIKKLAEDISELSSCFREISDLVQDQSIVIDDIDTKVENARVDVKRGVAALSFARSYRDKLLENKRRLVIILAAIFLFFLIVIIVVCVTGGEEDSEMDIYQVYDLPQSQSEPIIDYYPEYSPCDPNTDPYCIG